MTGHDDDEQMPNPAPPLFTAASLESDSDMESLVSDSSSSSLGPRPIAETSRDQSQFSAYFDSSQYASAYVIRNLSTGDSLDLCDESKTEFGVAFACLIDHSDHIAKYKRI